MSELGSIPPLSVEAAPRRVVLGPLHEPLFRSLWIAAVISYTGRWMQTVGAGWLMTSLTMSPFMVGMVQAASSIAVFLVVLPAGAIADVVDRRKLLLFTQVWMVVTAAALGVLTLASRCDADATALVHLPHRIWRGAERSGVAGHYTRGGVARKLRRRGSPELRRLQRRARHRTGDRWGDHRRHQHRDSFPAKRGVIVRRYLLPASLETRSRTDIHAPQSHVQDHVRRFPLYANVAYRKVGPGAQRRLQHRCHCAAGAVAFVGSSLWLARLRTAAGLFRSRSGDRGDRVAGDAAQNVGRRTGRDLDRDLRGDDLCRRTLADLPDSCRHQPDRRHRLDPGSGQPQCFCPDDVAGPYAGSCHLDVPAGAAGRICRRRGALGRGCRARKHGVVTALRGYRAYSPESPLPIGSGYILFPFTSQTPWEWTRMLGRYPRPT